MYAVTVSRPSLVGSGLPVYLGNPLHPFTATPVMYAVTASRLFRLSRQSISPFHRHHGHVCRDYVAASRPALNNRVKTKRATLFPFYRFPASPIWRVLAWVSCPLTPRRRPPRLASTARPARRRVALACEHDGRSTPSPTRHARHAYIKVCAYYAKGCNWIPRNNTEASAVARFTHEARNAVPCCRAHLDTLSRHVSLEGQPRPPITQPTTVRPCRPSRHAD